MAKTFQIVDVASPPSLQTQEQLETEWSLCVICQDKRSMDNLVCPGQSKRKDVGIGYKSLAENLIKFDELNLLPKTLQLNRIDKGEGVEAALSSNNGKWHKSCRLQFNNTKLERAQKRIQDQGETCENSLGEKLPKRKRSTEAGNDKDTCFFCGESDGKKELHEAATFKLNKNVKKAATLIGDMQLLGRLSSGDMIAQDAKYHTNCLLRLYNRVRACKTDAKNEECKDATASGIVFAELVMFLEEARYEENVAPVFKLADLVKLYESRLKQFNIGTDEKVHSTRLKERLLKHIPDLRAHNKGRDVFLVFEEDIGAALARVVEQDDGDDDDAVQLANAAKIVRRDLFEKLDSFNGSFKKGCQEDSVPKLLLALVSMILDGTNIEDQINTTQAALTIAQLLKFNAVRHQRKAKTVSVRHSLAQETPLLIYVGLQVHAHTRKRELIDNLSHLGMSISYDRVLRLSTEMGNAVCKMYELQNIVCPPTMRGNLFTTAAVDNIDHNPSSTTAKHSFHGTSISMLQHKTSQDDGVVRSSVPIDRLSTSKSVNDLPDYYTDVPPVSVGVKGSPVPAGTPVSLQRNDYKSHKEEENRWLKNVHETLLDPETEAPKNISWAAYHANRYQKKDLIVSPSALLTFVS